MIKNLKKKLRKLSIPLLSRFIINKIVSYIRNICKTFANPDEKTEYFQRII